MNEWMNVLFARHGKSDDWLLRCGWISFFHFFHLSRSSYRWELKQRQNVPKTTAVVVEEGAQQVLVPYNGLWKKSKESHRLLLQADARRSFFVEWTYERTNGCPRHGSSSALTASFFPSLRSFAWLTSINEFSAFQKDNQFSKPKSKSWIGFDGIIYSAFHSSRSHFRYRRRFSDDESFSFLRSLHLRLCYPSIHATTMPGFSFFLCLFHLSAAPVLVHHTHPSSLTHSPSPYIGSERV